MATAAKRRKLNTGIRVFEDVTGTIAGRQANPVDREKCILYGVRVLGFSSDNDRYYPPEVLRQAITEGKYEGKSVRMNHPKEPDEHRDVGDVNGWLENVVLTEDGLRGDWHLNPKHHMTEAILWAAENKPTQYGLSHNVAVEGEPEGGKYVIKKIVEVTSVDLVADPATVKGLFESRGKRAMKIKRKSILEGLEARFDTNKRKRLKKLLPLMEDMMGDSEYMPDEEEKEPGKMGPDEHLWQGVKEACHAVVEDEDMSADEKHKKLKMLLKGHEKMTSDAEEDEDPEGERDVDVQSAGDEDDEWEKKESRDLRRQLKQLQDKEEVRQLCEDMSFRPSKIQLKSLLLLDKTERKEFITEAKKSSGAGRPRSSSVTESRDNGSGSGGEAIDTSKITTNEGFTAALRGAS